MSRLALLLVALAAGCAAPSEPAPSEPAPSEPAPPSDVEMPGGAASADTLFADEADYRARRAEAVAALDAEVGDPTATSAASCRAFPVGERACGGPASFVVASTETADVPTVLRLTGAVADLDRRANVQFERVSTCEVRLPPPVELRDGRCVVAE